MTVRRVLGGRRRPWRRYRRRGRRRCRSPRLLQREAASDEHLSELAEWIERCKTATWLADPGFEHEVADLLEFNSPETVSQLRDRVFVDG